MRWQCLNSHIAERAELVGCMGTSYLNFGLPLCTSFDIACDLDLLNGLDIHPFIQRFVLVHEKRSAMPRDVCTGA